MFYLEYNNAVNRTNRHTFQSVVNSTWAKMGEALKSHVNGNWHISSSLEVQPGLNFALAYAGDKAGTDTRCQHRFVIFAYDEDALITLKDRLRAWPSNARGVIVIVGEGKSKSFLSELIHEVHSSKRAKDKILTVIAETVLHDRETLATVVTHLTKKK